MNGEVELGWLFRHAVPLDDCVECGSKSIVVHLIPNISCINLSFLSVLVVIPSEDETEHRPRIKL